MHHDDSGMSERGDMFWNRRKGNILLGMIARILFRFGKKERFKPDLYIDEGYDLSEYGLDAKVLHIQGHSKGSIGIQTAGGDLFCGDLFENKDKPVLSSIMDDLTAANESVKKVKKLRIKTVYPGHGRPFPMELFIKQFRQNGLDKMNGVTNETSKYTRRKNYEKVSIVKKNLLDNHYFCSITTHCCSTRDADFTQ